jgi:hypothetical protein
MNEAVPRKKELVLMIPLLKNTVSDAEKLAISLCGAGLRDFAASQGNLGIDKESWFLTGSPERDYVIVYVEGEDMERSLKDLVASDKPYDLWIKNQVTKLTGIDWNNPTSMVLPRQILRYGY